VLRLLSFGGKHFFRLIAGLIVLISVAASYYMTYFNVVIGYGIIVSVMTTDIDLSKEVIGFKFVLWMLAVSALPLWLIARNEMRGTLLEQMKTPGQRLKPLLVWLLAGLLVWLPLRMMDKEQKANERLSNVDMPSYGGVVAHSYLPSNWLAALGLFVYTQIDESRDAGDLFNPAEAYRYEPPADIDDTYVVFIIGETTRWDHMPLRARPATPRPSSRCAACLCAKAALRIIRKGR
jgi:KDO II ethanolaminephosphotransferase